MLKKVKYSEVNKILQVVHRNFHGGHAYVSLSQDTELKNQIKQMNIFKIFSESNSMPTVTRLLGAYKSSCMNRNTSLTHQNFKLALKNARLIQIMESRSKVEISRYRERQQMLIINKYKNLKFTIHEDNLKICNKPRETFMTDGDIFRMIALSVLNEAKTDNIRLLCENCHNKSRSCDDCSFQNTSLSITEKENLKLLQKNIWLETNPKNPEKKIVKCRYLLKEPANKLYNFKDSNYKLALESSIRLRNKLEKLNLLERYHNTLKEEVEDGFIEVLDIKDIDNSMPIYFSTINYVLITTAVKDKLRQTQNCSFYHKNGSLNQNSIEPPALLGDPIKMLLCFRTNQYSGILDLRAAFKMLFMDPISNNLRNFVWIESMENQVFKVYRPLRVIFGSALSTAFLDISRMKYIAKEVKTPQALASLLSYVYVDDQTFFGKSPEELMQTQEEICRAYEKYSFEVKHVFTSLDTDTRTQFLGLDWKLGSIDKTTGQKEDLIKPNIFFSLQKNKRGKNGEELSLQNIDDLILTKTVASRVVGILFSYLNCDLTPILASAKTYFTKISVITQSWKTPIITIDKQLHDEFYNFLKSLIGINDRLQYQKRVVIEENATIDRIYVCHDSGDQIISSNVYIVSRNNKTKQLESNIIMSKTKVGRLSLPKMELLGSKLGLGLLSKLIRSCPRLKDYDFPIYFLTDSEANTFQYNPNKVHKCIVTRNCTTIVTKGIKDILEDNKNIQRIYFAFCNSHENAADTCSKIFPNSIEVANSSFFKHGHELYCKEDFPKNKNIFLTFLPSMEVIYKPVKIRKPEAEIQEEAETKMIAAKLNLWPIHYTRREHCCSNCEDEIVELTGHTFAISANSIQDDQTNSNQIDTQNIHTWNKEDYTRLVNRFSSLNKILRTLARIKAIIRNFKLHKQFSGTFTTADLVHAFLTLVKTSQELYVSKDDIKRYEVITNKCNIQFFRTRIAVVRENDKFFETHLIPYIPTEDKQLVNLLIQNAHTVSVQDPLGVSHLGNLLTKTRLQQGIFAAFIPRVTKKIRSFIDKCGACKRMKTKFNESFPTRHRFLQYYNQAGLFTHCSLDLSAPIMLRPSKLDKRPRKYYILVCLCLFSSATCLILVEDYSKTSVLNAIALLQLKFSCRISLILTDAGSQLAALNPNDSIFQTPPKIITAGTSNQLLNTVESITGKLKKLIATMFLCKQKLNFPTLTLLQCQSMLELISNIYNTRLVSAARHNDKDIFISPSMLIHTHLSEKQCQISIEDIWTNLEGKNEALLNTITQNRNFKDVLVNELKTLISCNNRIFIQRRNDIKFEKNDICLVKRGSNQLKLVQIEDITDSGNFCKIRILNNKKLETQETHTSLLSIVYRPHN